MSIHINARPGSIAPIVLLPGDPLRAKHFAEKFLENAEQVANTRNMFYYTGTYKGTRLTIGASGMGCPSIGIYSYELYKEYNVECIMRVGTAGAYDKNMKVYDLVNVDKACSESTYAKFACELDGDILTHQGKAYDIINETAKKLNQPLIAGTVHSSDIFYRKNPALPEIASKHHCMAVEMEAFSLFANAQLLNKMAATLLTISDVIPTGEHISPEDRERSLAPMMTLALESSIEINKHF